MNDAMNEITMNKLHLMAAAIGAGLIRVELSQHETAQHLAADKVAEALKDLVNYVNDKLASKGIIMDMEINDIELSDEEEE